MEHFCRIIYGYIELKCISLWHVCVNLTDLGQDTLGVTSNHQLTSGLVLLNCLSLFRAILTGSNCKEPCRTASQPVVEFEVIPLQREGSNQYEIMQLQRKTTMESVWFSYYFFTVYQRFEGQFRITAINDDTSAATFIPDLLDSSTASYQDVSTKVSAVVSIFGLRVIADDRTNIFFSWRGFKERGIGCALVAYFRLANSTFCGVYVKMNHLEVQLMVSSRVGNSKVLWMTIQFEYFSDRKAKWRM